MSTVEQSLPRKAGPSVVVQIVILVLMTAAAVGMGWLSGAYLQDKSKPAEKPAAESPSHKSGEGGDERLAKGTLVQLAPITTNLAAPDTMWVRLEVSLVLTEPQPPEMAERIHQDLLAYARTLRIHQIQGASALRQLKTDLDERAALRSGGKVKEVLIRTLLFE